MVRYPTLIFLTHSTEIYLAENLTQKEFWKKVEKEPKTRLENWPIWIPGGDYGTFRAGLIRFKTILTLFCGIRGTDHIDKIRLTDFKYMYVPRVQINPALNLP